FERKNWRELLYFNLTAATKIAIVYKIILKLNNIEKYRLEMINISSKQKNIKSESPKTPGGISKSLLTPCRRVGLSRNWRKSGPSPFISPLSGTESSVEAKQEKSTKKRKFLAEEEEVSQDINVECIEAGTSCNTPRANVINRSRNILPRKKSKTLLLAKECDEENEKVAQISAINNDETTDSTKLEVNPDSPKNITTNDERVDSTKFDVNTDCPKNIKVSKLSRATSKNKSKILNCESNDTEAAVEKSNRRNTIAECKQKSPDNLAKECFVVIQKKLFKSSIDKIDTCDKLKPAQNSCITQVLFDSDSDDTPLINSNKEQNQSSIQKNDDDDEFQENKKPIKKLQHKTTSTTELKTNSNVKPKPKTTKKKTKSKEVEYHVQSSQYSNDFDDDDFVSDKRTILIKKSYDKIAKPSKSKSTGSITQKDIDELKARIEMKKNMLLAKAMTNETDELRSLIKKWQKGCQNALTELLELMKTKMPDRQNMDTSEILQLLKIPPDLVGYDSENDIFNTPDDANIVLSGFSLK
ncbi:myb-like protein X, partial [Vanessa cardui]|uniref:myb-like protein X n=1 Tax=Vanessa cardui TaxID=171605 RepID=UPI001F1316F0